jgi:ribosomal protein S18 acetylase RimI-like enzyme
VPDRRGEGIGTELFETVERDLAATGHDAVALEVIAENEAARRLYDRLGYEQHRIELSKSLAPSESDNHSKEDG